VVCLRVCRIGTEHEAIVSAPATTRLAVTTVAHSPKSQVNTADPRSKVQGPRSEVQGPKSKVRGPRSKVQGSRSKVQGPRSKVSGNRVKKKRCCTSALRPHSYIIHRNSYIIAPPNISGNESSSEYRISNFYRPLATFIHHSSKFIHHRAPKHFRE
jgi:hypothetical protein